MQLACDELQTTMDAEMNRKRRKLEHNRRATENPQPGAFIKACLDIVITLTFE